jgi:hypothetical protein
MATCAVVGQGVGTAAALAVAKGVPAGQIAVDEELINDIQQRLLRDDTFLIGRRNDGPDDRARSARISASSEQEGGAAVSVVSGQTRSVHGSRGVPADRSVAGSHCWMSAAEELPAWIRFDWSEPQPLSALQLVFDTGLHRHLTLSHHDGYTSKMLWGRPQPETVSDYAVQVDDQGEWSTVCTVADNFQRLRRHCFPRGIVTRSIRILVTLSNGIDHARIMEVRIH